VVIASMGLGFSPPPISDLVIPPRSSAKAPMLRL